MIHLKKQNKKKTMNEYNFSSVCVCVGDGEPGDGAAAAIAGDRPAASS